jgi:hypothetical protein
MQIDELNGAVLALIGVVITVIANIVIGNIRKKADYVILDRKLLSEEQTLFKKGLTDELTACRLLVEKLQEENSRLHDKIFLEKQDKLKLNEEIIELRFKIIQLKQSIEELHEKIKVLQST